MYTLGNTYIEAEEKAYNVPLTRTQRKGKAVDDTGKLVTVYLGVPETMFTIPAFVRSGNKRIHGWVAVSNEVFRFFRGK